MCSAVPKIAAYMQSNLLPIRRQGCATRCIVYVTNQLMIWKQYFNVLINFALNALKRSLVYSSYRYRQEAGER